MDTTSPILEDTPKLWFLYDVRVWGVIAAVVVAVIAYIRYTSVSATPWVSDPIFQTSIWDWVDFVKNWFSTTEPTAPPPDPVTAPPAVTPPTVAVEQETWCLVAEDLAGRYCVKVPGPQSCTHKRSYLSLDQCTFTPAMHLPARLTTNSGQAFVQ